MTKELRSIAFDPRHCAKELEEFERLLDSKRYLNERDDVQKFFRERIQLTAFFGTYFLDIGPAELIAFEFPIGSDFVADLVLGNREKGTFCVVEFEDGKPNSIFKKRRSRTTTEWSPRFEHGFSQLVDWFYTLDDFKKTDRFADDFGHGHIRFNALLVVGRDSGISQRDRNRLRWRTEKVRVDSHTVECLTFDDLHDALSKRLEFYLPESELDRRNRPH